MDEPGDSCAVLCAAAALAVLLVVGVWAACRAGQPADCGCGGASRRGRTESYYVSVPELPGMPPGAVVWRARGGALRTGYQSWSDCQRAAWADRGRSRTGRADLCVPNDDPAGVIAGARQVRVPYRWNALGADAETGSVETGGVGAAGLQSTVGARGTAPRPAGYLPAPELRR